MRRWIGILAIAFPILLLIFAGFPMQTSLSATYWTPANTIFVSLLVTMGIFLLSYHGYDKRDDWISGIAGASMIGVAMFPCLGSTVPDYAFMFLSPNVTHIIHIVFSAITFGLLGVMSIWQFTQGHADIPNVDNSQKHKMNRVYRICGYTIFGLIIAAIPLNFIPAVAKFTYPIRLWYWLESGIVWAFGVSWIVKGKMLWRDH